MKHEKERKGNNKSVKDEFRVKLNDNENIKREKENKKVEKSKSKRKDKDVDKEIDKIDSVIDKEIVEDVDKDKVKDKEASSDAVAKSRKGFRESKKPKPVEIDETPVIYTKEMFQHNQCKVGEQLPFTCDRCFISKTSRNKYIYTTKQKTICNGCYALLISKGKEEIKKAQANIEN